MKSNTCKKLLAIILCCAVFFSLLAGCKNEPAQPTDENGNVIPTGTLLLNFGAILSVSYDNKGQVLKVEGYDDQGVIIADNLTDHVGTPVKEFAEKLIRKCVDEAYLDTLTGSALIRLGMTSSLPYDNFIDEIKSAVEKALKNADTPLPILYIDKSVMDEEGYFNVDILKTLVTNYLGVAKLDAFYGDTTPSDGKYLCTVDAEEMQFSFVVDAFSGQIRKATPEDLLGDTDDYLEEEPNYDYGNGLYDPGVEEDFGDIDIPLP